MCPFGSAWGFGFADLESGGLLRCRTRDLGEQLVAVVDEEGVVGALDGDGAAGVDHAEVDALPGHHKGATAADPTLL